jgi:hypothetical protein
MNNLATTSLFLTGVLVAGYAVAALFFLKFWKQTGDRIFGFFAASFALLVVQRVALGWAIGSGSDTTWYYVMRLLAFVLIIVAIVDKNRAART